MNSYQNSPVVGMATAEELCCMILSGEKWINLFLNLFRLVQAARAITKTASMTAPEANMDTTFQLKFNVKYRLVGFSWLCAIQMCTHLDV